MVTVMVVRLPLEAELLHPSVFRSMLWRPWGHVLFCQSVTHHLRLSSSPRCHSRLDLWSPQPIQWSIARDPEGDRSACYVNRCSLAIDSWFIYNAWLHYKACQPIVNQDAFARFMGIRISVNAFKHPKFLTSKLVPITPIKIQVCSPMVRVQMMDQVEMI